MGLIVGIVLAVAFGLVCTEDWEDVSDFLAVFVLAFAFVMFAYGGLWLLVNVV